MPRNGLTHGVSAYRHGRCRCPVCTAAASAYQRAYLASHPEQYEKHKARVRARYLRDKP